MTDAERLDHLLAEARRADPDRYLCSLFAPPDRREAVLALVLLGAELSRVPAAVSQPMLGLIRYQWWRDAIDEAAQGRPRAQPVVEALAAGLGGGGLRAEALQALVDAHEAAFEDGPSTDLPTLERREAATGGALQALILDALGGPPGGPEREAAALVGTAHELSRLPDREGNAAVAARVATHLAEARRLAPRPPSERMAAFLPALLVGPRRSALAPARLWLATLLRRF